MAIDSAAYPDLGLVALVNSTNIKVQNFDLLDNTPCILLAYTNDSSVTNNKISYSTQAIMLVHSSNNNISENEKNI